MKGGWIQILNRTFNSLQIVEHPSLSLRSALVPLNPTDKSIKILVIIKR